MTHTSSTSLVNASIQKNGGIRFASLGRFNFAFSISSRETFTRKQLESWSVQAVENELNQRGFSSLRQMRQILLCLLLWPFACWLVVTGIETLGPALGWFK